VQLVTGGSERPGLGDGADDLELAKVQDGVLSLLANRAYI